MFSAFDEGLRFYKPGANSLSPDRQYSIVSFSAEGGVDDSSGVSVLTEYLCAFVRMKDGCVVHVAQDAVCGGEWHRLTSGPSTLNRSSIIRLIQPTPMLFTHRNIKVDTKFHSHQS